MSIPFDVRDALLAVNGALLLASGLLLVRIVRSDARLKEARKLDELKTTMLSIASHQIRGPLGGIRGYLTMFRDGDLGALTPAQKEIVALNLSVVTRLLDTVETFLDITKLESGKLALRKEDLPFDEAIAETVKEFESAFRKKGLALAFAVDGPRPVRVAGDPDKIRHVVFNLIDNALKCTERGRVVLRLRRDGGEAIFEVADTGIGIPSGEADRLFGKFERGRPAIGRDGSGLGLYVVKMFMELQGGRCWAASPGAGKGSTFGVAVPLSPDIPKAA